MKRRLLLLGLILLAAVLIGTVPALAEEAVPEPGPTLEEQIAALGPRPKTLYVGIAQTAITIRSGMSREAPSIGRYAEGSRVEITGYEPEWLSVVQEDSDGLWISGYVLRHLVDGVTKVDEDALPYPCVPSAFVGTLARDSMAYTEPGGTEPLYQFTNGARVAVVSIEDGWAKIIYWRQYGYFNAADLADVEPVYDLQTAEPGDVIAAYNSFYNMADTELNNNRKWNIKLCCEYISITLEPGFRFNFNRVGGPYTYSRGYKDGIAFVNGKAVPTPGGGTCQVSSTLYNVLLAVSDGITIIHRRPHGPSGATYLPHGADAAVGNDTLNLIFRNDFDYPVVLYGYPQDGVLYIEMRKGADA